MIYEKMIDELGTINQQIAELETISRRLKNELIARGVGKYAGLDFVAEVQHYDRATINPVLVKEYGTSAFVQQVTQVKTVDAVVVKRVAV